MSTDEPMWMGVENSPSLHRTTGIRAWCHGCTEWCYSPADQVCRCCAVASTGYWLELGEGLELSSVVHYKSGTIQLTIKKRP